MNVMKSFTILMMLFIVFGPSQANSQISVSPWEIHEGTEGVLKHSSNIHGDPSAYKLMKIPGAKDAGWKPAPKDAKGNVSMKRSSVLRCREEVDFTYFQTIVNIPANTTVTDFKVSYDNADDGARIYFFNSKFPNGTFDEKSDLIGKHANFASTNLKDKVVTGENRIVIVQFDDCADNNSIDGIRVTVNGKEVAPQQNTGVCTVFEHINYGGKSKSFDVGIHKLAGTDFNDIISSVKIQNGYSVVVYEHDQTRGKSTVYNSDIASLVNTGFNDVISTIEIVKGNTAAPASFSENIAKGKQCKASSVSFGGAASRAVDGNTNGAYSNNSCTHTNDENNPWWEVDLGAVYDISRIVIWNRTDDCCWNRLQGFYVMVSEQAITGCDTASQFQFKTGGSLSFTNSSQSNITLDGNKKGRYVRIFIQGNTKTLSLAEVEVFGQISKTQAAVTPEASTVLPDKFKVHAFSVHEGKQEKDDYWFALNANNSRGVILNGGKLVNGAKWMEIQRVDLGNNMIAFKIENAGTDMYLIAKDNKEVHVEKAVGGKVPDGAKFKTVVPLTSAKGANENNYRSFESIKFPNHFLRHQGYILFVHTNNNTELFKQDASWLIQKM